MIKKCKCGLELKHGFIEVSHDKDGKLIKVWRYRCDACLQGYFQKLPEDIEIKND